MSKNAKLVCKLLESDNFSKKVLKSEKLEDANYPYEVLFSDSV